MANTVFDFLAYCLSDKKPIPEGLEGLNWDAMYQFARQQSVVGVMFIGVQRLKETGVEIPRQLFLKWFSQTEKIGKRNMLMNMRTVATVSQYRQEGFDCCVLKGQGNATMYPNPLVRTAGDIDLWVDAKRDDIVDFVHSKFPDAEVRYYHVEYKDNGIPVEAHFMPGIMNNPFYNRRLQQYYSEMMAVQCNHTVELPGGSGHIPVPTVEFNLIFQLAHMMHHFFDEGIGLRQMIDYYFLLKRAKDEAVDMRKLENLLKHLNLYKFAGAVMCIMHEVLGLENEFLIVPSDKKRGKTLFREIVKGGNFGHFSGLTKHPAWQKYFLKHARSLHFMREYPAEALSEPFFRTWHFFWRMVYR